MKINLKNPPRYFQPRGDDQITIADMGEIFLDDFEQLTLVTESGKEYDVAKRPWGFASPSLNGRLKQFGFRMALVRNKAEKYYAMAVEVDKMNEFEKYCTNEEQEVVRWLDELD